MTAPENSHRKVGKGKRGQTNQWTLAISHMRGAGGTNQSAGNGVGEKWLDFVCIAKVEPTEFAEG